MGFDPSSFEYESYAARVRLLADQACSTGGYQTAGTVIAQAIRKDAGLIEYAVRFTAHEAVSKAMRIKRVRIMTGFDGDEDLPVGPRGGKKEVRRYSKEEQVGVSKVGGKYLSGYLSWPLSCKKELGDAVLDEIVAEAEMYERHASGNARAGRFMRLIQKRMLALKAKPGEPLRNVLDESVLASLMAKAQKGREGV